MSHALAALRCDKRGWLRLGEQREQINRWCWPGRRGRALSQLALKDLIGSMSAAGLRLPALLRDISTAARTGTIDRTERAVLKTAAIGGDVEFAASALEQRLSGAIANVMEAEEETEELDWGGDEDLIALAGSAAVTAGVPCAPAARSEEEEAEERKGGGADSPPLPLPALLRQISDVAREGAISDERKGELKQLAADGRLVELSAALRELPSAAAGLRDLLDSMLNAETKEDAAVRMRIPEGGGDSTPH